MAFSSEGNKLKIAEIEGINAIGMLNEVFMIHADGTPEVNIPTVRIKYICL